MGERGRRRVPIEKAWTPAKVRERIQVTKLVTVLMQCADGLLDLSKERLRAIEILLRKSLPDLQSVDLNATITSKGESLMRVEFIERKPDGA